MLNEKVITGLKTRLESILKNYFTSSYEIEMKDGVLVGKGFGKDAITISYKDSQINYEIHPQFLNSFFKMNKLITVDKNLSTKYYCKPLSHTIIRMYNDYLEQPLAPLTETDLNSFTTIAISGPSIESIAFDTFRLPVLDNKKKVREKKFDVMIVSTANKDYAFKILEIVDINIKSELTRTLLQYFNTPGDFDSLVEQLMSTQSGLESMIDSFEGLQAGVGF